MTFVFSRLKFILKDFDVTGELSSWKASTDNDVLGGLSFTYFFTVFKMCEFIYKIVNVLSKLHQLISAGVGINDEPFFSKYFSAGDKTLLLKLTAFCSRLVVLTSSIILLSFSQYLILFSLLCLLCFDFLKLLLLQWWLKRVISSLWYFLLCLCKIEDDSSSVCILISS